MTDATPEQAMLARLVQRFPDLSRDELARRISVETWPEAAHAPTDQTMADVFEELLTVSGATTRDQ